MRAAILHQRRSPLVLEEVELAEPAAGEARVRILASGVCHSDLHHIQRDSWTTLPLLLGHEGAGVVEAVGPGVTSVQAGDRVVIAFGMRCGECFFCRRGEPFLCATPWPTNVRVRLRDQPVQPFLNVGSFAEYANVQARNLVVIPPEMPIDCAALLACGVSTGVGAVINTAKVEPGANVVVIGIGGVGLSAVQGARLAGAARVIAVDVVDHKLELAREFGATHVVNARQQDPVAAVQALTNGWGADYAFEVIGNARTIQQAYDAVRKGGTAVVVGLAPEDAQLTISPAALMRTGKVLMGCSAGSVRPQYDIPRYVDLFLNGRLKLRELISRRFALEEVNEAFAAMEGGEVARGVVVFE